MAEIIYFGTNGCSGHYPIGIDKTLTGAEYEIWCECDNETWINNIRKNPGRHVIKHHGEVYTNYGVPFSVDEDRVGDHTELFWKGIHTEEEIINLIKNDSFLSKQFNLNMALPKNYSIWLAVDYDGIEKAFWYKPKRCEKHGEWWGDKMVLPHGSVKKLIGRELSWSDEPVELKEE